MAYKPTILGISDSIHYLVGAIDEHNNFSALPSMDEVAVCHSLAQAKELLKDNHVSSAQLKLYSAYDEMCGLPSPMNQRIIK